MIKPFELDARGGHDTWATLVAASAGDVATLRRLLERNPRLARAEYWYAPAVHFAAREGHVDAVRLLLDAGADAGATITARDDDYRSTPLAWAARANNPEMVAYLLSRGAPVTLPDDEPWATPLAWAERRGQQQVVSMLRAHGATR